MFDSKLFLTLPAGLDLRVLQGVEEAKVSSVRLFCCLFLSLMWPAAVSI
jgi:hypothetical protein